MASHSNLSAVLFRGFEIEIELLNTVFNHSISISNLNPLKENHSKSPKIVQVLLRGTEIIFSG